MGIVPSNNEYIEMRYSGLCGFAYLLYPWPGMIFYQNYKVENIHIWGSLLPENIHNITGWHWHLKVYNIYKDPQAEPFQNPNISQVSTFISPSHLGVFRVPNVLDSVDGSEIRREPVEVGSLSIIYKVLHIPGG